MTETSDLKRRAQRIAGFLDQIEDIKADLKVERKAAKDAGYDVKALGQVIREMRADKEKVDAQLTFEFVLDNVLDLVEEPGDALRTALEV